MLSPLRSSPSTSPTRALHVPTRRPLKDLLRWVLVTCVLLLSCFTFSNLQYVQRTLDSFEIETLPSLFSSVSSSGSSSSRTNSHYRARHDHHARGINSTWNDNDNANEGEDEDDLPCLTHKSLLWTVNASSSSGRVASDPKQQQQQQQCGTLKRKWLYNPPLSHMARLIDQHQTNCSAPVASHYFDNTYGLGSHLILWGQAMCNAMQQGTKTTSKKGRGLDDDHSSYRIQSRSPDTWLWLDQTHCSVAQARDQSPLVCYFPKAERRCDHHHHHHQNGEPPITTTTNRLLFETAAATETVVATTSAQTITNDKNISDPRQKKFHCPWVRNPDTRSFFRAAATEYLFQQVSPLVIQEAKRQVGVVFASNGGVVPDDIVTVHIRWGDKFWEMDLPPIEEYVQAIHNITTQPSSPPSSLGVAAAAKTTSTSTMTEEARSVNIYLATEDPKAYEAFVQAKPREWTVYADITLMEINPFRPQKGNRASWATRNTKGRAGLVALGSLLVAMEASRFVLTTKSNWSTLLNHLRKNIIDPRCGNCTTMIDLRPGEYY